MITRALAIAPCLLVVSFSGREGLAKILNASQVVLSILLPVVSAPLIWFTCNKHTMRVPIFVRDGDEEIDMEYDGEQSTLVATSRFKSSEPAIRLQNLRNSHPCANWEDDDDEQLQQLHLQNEENRLLIGENTTNLVYSLPPTSNLMSRSNSVSATNGVPDSLSSSSSTTIAAQLPLEV